MQASKIVFQIKSLTLSHQCPWKIYGQPCVLARGTFLLLLPTAKTMESSEPNSNAPIVLLTHLTSFAKALQMEANSRIIATRGNSSKNRN